MGFPVNTDVWAEKKNLLDILGKSSTKSGKTITQEKAFAEIGITIQKKS